MADGWDMSAMGGKGDFGSLRKSERRRWETVPQPNKGVLGLRASLIVTRPSLDTKILRSQNSAVLGHDLQR